MSLLPNFHHASTCLASNSSTRTREVELDFAPSRQRPAMPVPSLSYSCSIHAVIVLALDCSSAGVEVKPFPHERNTIDRKFTAKALILQHLSQQIGKHVLVLFRERESGLRLQ